MRLKQLVVGGILLLASLLLFMGCPPKPVQIVDQPQLIIGRVINQEDNSTLAVVLIESSSASEDPVVNVANTLDRSIQLDFDGDRHVTFSVGDRNEGNRTFKAGDYKIMISAPGLKFIPEKNMVPLQNYKEYTLALKRLTKSVEYNK